MTWYFALCQHPMYMIIENDETAAERTPPWGERDIVSYVDRIRRNLASLDRYPHLKFNYDISGVELEGLAERAPDVIERLRHFVRIGRVGFVNGSYAQAHLHSFGAESNLRQMFEGLDAIKRIAGVKVTSYAHQEPAIHDQMPQILRSLGYRFAVTPGFFWVLSFLTAHEILGVQYQGLHFLQDEEFTRWRGLDGTEVPLYLTQPRLRPKGGVHGSDSHRAALRQEFVKDHLHYPPIRCDFPDMVDIDDDWVDDHQGHEFVVLDEALQSRLAETPARSAARLYTYWGYGDGIEAERLHRADRQGELALLEAESLGVLAQELVGRPADNLREAWRSLLRAQHHDAYWVGGMGLREKAVSWADQARRTAEAAIGAATDAIVSQLPLAVASEGVPLVMWEPWPVARTDVAEVHVTVPAGQSTDFEVRGVDGAAAPCQVIGTETAANGSTRATLLFPARTTGLGYQLLRLIPAVQTETKTGGLTFENGYYRAAMAPDGTFASLRTLRSDVELIADSTYRGNLLRAQDPEGRWLEFVPSEAPTITDGPVAGRIRVAGTVGDADLVQEITLYHHHPRIDFTLAFDFHDTSYGNYWQDETKLNVYWPVAPRGGLDHDIPFGVVPGHQERSFFPTAWARLGSARAGLAFFHRGTNRCWVRNNVLANVLACGVIGRDIGTRAQPQMYIKDYDLRLRGHHVISYAIYPHEGSWREAAVPRQAFSYQHPLRVMAAGSSVGHLPPAVSMARLEDDALIPTAVYAGDGGPVFRLFETTGSSVRVDMALATPWRLAGLRALGGEPVGQVDPFSIAEAILKR